jgi:threonine/homoserine/homoserine lactone efflux protein
MYVMARAMTQGPHAAVLSAFGIALGDLLQVVATAAGLSTLWVSAPAIFLMLKLAGAAYLVVLGVLTVIGKGARTARPIEGNLRPLPPAKRSLIVQGLLALNPKTALFFLAFLPQFLDPRAGSTGAQMLTFGVAFVVLGFCTNSLFGCLGGKLGDVARSNRAFEAATRYASGIILMGLGVLAAFAPLPKWSA